MLAAALLPLLCAALAGGVQAGHLKGIAGVLLADNLGGMTDRVYVSAPPSTEYVLSLERGSFLDCGAGMAVFQTDEDGRSMAPLTCGVTLAETLVIPSASKPARLIIHY